jgi:hypothetical protein
MGEYPYTLSVCALGHHYKVVQWFSLVCSVCSVPTEVSPEVSVQITKGPLLRHVVLGRVHSLTPLIPNQTDPKRVQSIRTTDWYAKLGSATYYTRPYPYSLMVVLFSWVVAP